MQTLGTDIIEIARIEKAIVKRGQTFLNYVFTPGEQAYCKRFKNPYPSFAARFCAKEAVAKALGTGIGAQVSFKEIEIVKEDSGKPSILLTGKGKDLLPKGHSIEISLSHCKEYALATALVFPNPSVKN